MFIRIAAGFVFLSGHFLCSGIHAQEVVSVQNRPALSAESLAKDVTIHRDEWGVPHIYGKSDAATVFGMGYCQAEDYFWQLEDNCIQAIGRYAEIIGPEGLRSDVLNRTFEVPRRSQEDYEKLDPHLHAAVGAFAHGVNFYLKTHPDVTPRLITKFEPWHVIAMDRHFILDFTYGRSHAGRPRPNFEKTQQQKNAAQRSHPQRVALNRLSWNQSKVITNEFQRQIRAATGSNQWAIGPSRTKSGNAMLFINPHQPWYGWGQYYESHLKSEEGLNFSGGGFFGSPIPLKGHNERLGWAYTVNEPDMADSWREVFDHPTDPLLYRHGKDYRKADEWTDIIRVKEKGTDTSYTYTFRRTHHGPIVRRENDKTFLSANVAGIFDPDRPRQAFDMATAQNFEEWYAAISHCALPMFNVAYADCDGNIFYGYNGTIPVRDPSFNWRSPVDGTNPKTDWKAVHAFAELPQVFNPRCGFVQNCNSAPFTTSDGDNPFRGDFPTYMLEDGDVDKRRAKMSRHLLRNTRDITFNEFRTLAFDTTMYWPLVEIPRFKRDFQRLKSVNPKLADRVRPYFDHLCDWDCRADLDSTRTALCIEWYRNMYGDGQGESIRTEFSGDRLKRFEALVAAAGTLQSLYGDWKVKWGKVHRIQRVTERHDLKSAAFTFSPFAKDLPIAGAPGPMGIAFTIYSAPGVPLIRPNRYTLVGCSYASVVEFGDRVQAASSHPSAPVPTRSRRTISTRQSCCLNANLKMHGFMTMT